VDRVSASQAKAARQRAASPGPRRVRYCDIRLPTFWAARHLALFKELILNREQILAPI
jgi:hypothetical protein